MPKSKRREGVRSDATKNPRLRQAHPPAPVRPTTGPKTNQKTTRFCTKPSIPTGARQRARCMPQQTVPREGEGRGAFPRCAQRISGRSSDVACVRMHRIQSDRNPVGHPGHSPRKRHHHNLNGVQGSFARTRVPKVVGIQVKHGKVEFGRSGCRKVRMGFGPLLCRCVKVKSARRAVRRIAFGPNAAFWALNFHAAKVRNVEMNAVLFLYSLRGVGRSEKNKPRRRRGLLREVVRGGIEPSTQGFSVLCSTN